MTKIFVAGHRGMVGSAICRQLSATNDQVITATRAELDLTNQAQVADFFKANKFDQVYLAAAKVGGIHSNKTYPAEFIYENLMIQNNIIHSAHQTDVMKLLFLGSSCIYPKQARQPISEDELLSGYLESTNQPYAIAKIAGIKMCESFNRQFGRDYRSIMPTNLYGINDNFHPENSHVIPALIGRFHEAKTSNKPSVEVWGTGSAMREFLYVDDMAQASIFVMNLKKRSYEMETQPMLSHINVGSGVDCTIKELTATVARVVGYTGDIQWDATKPDGTPRKLMDGSRLDSLGWKAKINLEDGICKTYSWFLENQDNFRK